MPYDETNIMIDKINYQKRKEQEAEYVIERLSPYLNGVEPVSALKKLLMGYKGESINEKIYDYFKCGGKLIDFYDIFGEQQKEYLKHKKNSLTNKKLLKNSVGKHGAQPIKSQVKKKKVSKDRYKALLLAIILVASFSVPVAKIASDFYEEIQYENAIDKIEDSYLLNEGVSFNNLDKINISNFQDFDVIDFGNYLKEIGLSDHSIIYITFSVAGFDKVDELCREFYNESYSKILRDDFPYHFSTGKKVGDLEQLANHCQREITEKGLEMSKIIKEYKSKSIGGKH